MEGGSALEWMAMLAQLRAVSAVSEASWIAPGRVLYLLLERWAQLVRETEVSAL